MRFFMFYYLKNEKQEYFSIKYPRFSHIIFCFYLLRLLDLAFERDVFFDAPFLGIVNF